MKILSEVYFEDSDFIDENYFLNKEFEVEKKFGDRTAILFFEVEIIQTIETEETGSFIKREVIYVEYDSGCFKDDGEMVVLTQERVKELENELHNLLKS